MSPLHKASNVDFKPYYPGARRAVQRDGRYSDKSKYGYRMLQRMGWEEGKGLGSKEEGPREHIKVTVKRDNQGLGKKKGRDDDWIEHQDAFDQILANLNAQTVSSSTCECNDHTEESSPPPANALLETATDSKRLLYKKFLKSKDLSVQSSEDLDCVLARKRRKLSTETCKTLSAIEREQLGSTEKMGGTVDGIKTMTSHQSLQEYFSAKLDATRRKKTIETSRTNEQCSEQPQRAGKNRKKSKKRTRTKTVTS